MVAPMASIGSLLLTTSSSGGVSADLLAAWSAARVRLPSSLTAELSRDPNAPTPPWSANVGSPSLDALTEGALRGAEFFDLDAAQVTDLAAQGDYKRLFALYSGLRTLQGIATRLDDETLSLSRNEREALERQFNRGAAELNAFFSEQQFEAVRVVRGDRLDAAQTKLGLAVKTSDYLTGIVHRGSLSARVPGLDANAAFSIAVKGPSGQTQTVAIDLAQMGSIPRTFGAVISFINQRLAAAGAASRIEAVNQAPKTETAIVGGQLVERRYTGQPQYALKVSQKGGETLSFSANATSPAFYAIGQTSGSQSGAGARLIKFQDTDGAAGEPQRLDRPAATLDAIGAQIGAGLVGAGAPYVSAPAGLAVQRTGVMLVEGDSNTGAALRAAGDAVLRVRTRDGATIAVSVAWRAADQEQWRTRAGESAEAGIADDLAERLTQALHEQGVAAGVDVWRNGAEIGFSLLSGDSVSIDSFAINGQTRALTDATPAAPGDVGGLRAGVFARRFEAANVAPQGGSFTGSQTIELTTPQGVRVVTVDAGATGITGAALADQFNTSLRNLGLRAAVSIEDGPDGHTLRIDALHEISATSARLNGAAAAPVLASVGTWGVGGAPNAASGQPYGDARRTYVLSGGSPLSAPGNEGALAIDIVVDTARGPKTISVNVTAQERALDPDPAPGQWSSVLQTRLNDALNAAGVYVGANAADFSSFIALDGAGDRIASVTINGAPVTYVAQAPSGGVGGAYASVRSATSASLAASGSASVSALVSNDAVSVTLDTMWGVRTISTNLQPGDPRTLESAALRLNEALAAQGYDAGVVVAAISGGGTGLRVVSGASFSVRGLDAVSLGGESHALTLDPIDVASRADDPVGAAAVAQRLARGASAVETIPSSQSPFAAPTTGVSNWFAGRDFDISVGGGARVLAARATATAPDGSVYVLADIANASGDQPVKGVRDVALLKYDSAGKLLSTRTLGAAQEAQGFGLAVAADGRVAVSGAVTGALQGAGVNAGAADSFITVFDDDGAELWTARRGAAKADSTLALAFGADGVLYAAGKTASALTGQIALGGEDSYLRAYSSTGQELFTRQFGTSGDDAASALHVRDEGGGVTTVYVAGVENKRGVVRAFTASGGANVAAGPVRDIGDFRDGAIAALVSDGGDLYVGGAIGADRLSVGAAANASVSGQEGFVVRLDRDLASVTRDRTTYIGSTAKDSVAGLAIANGAVYAFGHADSALPGATRRGVGTGFAARLDDAGGVDWMRTFSSAGGAIAATGFAVDASGASALDRLGLPRGTLQTNDSTRLVDRSALRAGDEFTLSINGAAARTVRIRADDTLADLAVRIDRLVAGFGRARIVRENGMERLEISAQSGQSILLSEGAAGRNALGALGLNAGVIAPKAAAGARGVVRTFGLGLGAGDLDVSTSAAIKKSKSELSAATSILRQAYEALANPNAPEKTAEEIDRENRIANGAVPDYTLSQLRNYQAALARLGG
ncbi:MAG: hypothetical protein NW203_00025 [Hyphomonadaceae bacterium]|nr:hypothetical protein [Hyphomonadaceae bacterium]